MIARQNSPDRSSSRPRPGGRFQFGMRGLMATIVLLCVPFAIWGGLLRAGREADGSPRIIIFVLLCLAAPMGVMILLAAMNAAARVYRVYRPPKKTGDDGDGDDFASGG